jgi:hypothetical protein
MRSFAQPPNRSQKAEASDFSRPDLAAREADPRARIGSTSPGAGHDFSRMTVYSSVGGIKANPSPSKPGPPADHPPPFHAKPSDLRARLGEGRSLPQPLIAELSAEVGYDLGRLRIHADARGDLIARTLGAQAVSFGEDVAIRRDRYRPGSASSRELIKHEALHAAAGAGQAPRVQLKIEPEDISAEMNGLSFILRSAQGSIAKGERVEIVDWNGTAAQAKVRYDAVGSVVILSVPKLALEPDSPSAKGVRSYDAGLTAQQKAVEKRAETVDKRRGEAKKIQDKESEYNKNHKAWEAQLKQAEDEVKNQENLLAGAQKALNRVLIQQTMYNRFDPIIAKWVDFYNKQLKPAKSCDPNIVKSMMFEETRIGTSGKELSAGPSTDWSDINTPFHSHQNVLMNIVSAGEQQMIMLKDLAPDIFVKHHLDKFEKVQKPKEWNDTIIWGNPEFRAAVQEMFQRRDAGKHNALGSRDVDLQLDYEFWIRTGVRWLFFKYFFIKQTSWAEAAHAYNGLDKKGAGARYRDRVMKRVGGTTPLDVAGQ